MAENGKRRRFNAAVKARVAIESLAANPLVSVSLSKNHAERVLIDFILSKEGQTIIHQLRRNPSRTDMDRPVPRAARIKLMKIGYDVVAKNYNRYAKQFREIFSAR
ncbi:MAG: hypothetical protein HYY45_08975 [Deltaproteobacteria bacterium]|nr:hypothetical protein [Deltaproteobacteria bacterium]